MIITAPEFIFSMGTINSSEKRFPTIEFGISD